MSADEGGEHGPEVALRVSPRKTMISIRVEHQFKLLVLGNELVDIHDRVLRVDIVVTSAVYDEER